MCSELGRPTLVQFSPPSVDLYTPSPTETELRIQDSPLPTQTVFELDGSIVIAPIDCTGILSNTGRNVVPPSMDFQTPPEAAPTSGRVFPPSLRPATAAMRPLMVAEPMLRARRPEMTPLSRTGWASPAPVRTGGVEATRVAAPAGGGGMLRVTGWPWLGKRKSASLTSTF